MKIKSWFTKIALAMMLTTFIHSIPAIIAWLIGKGESIYKLPSLLKEISLIESGCYIDSHCSGSGLNRVCTEGGALICEPRLIFDFWEKAIIYFIIYFLLIAFTHLIIKRVKKNSTSPNND